MALPLDQLLEGGCRFFQFRCPHFPDGDVAALASPTLLEDFSDREPSLPAAAGTHHRLVDGLAARVPRTAPDIRRDRIPHRLVLQSNVSQGHEDVPGCVQSAARYLHVESEMELAGDDVRDEPLESEQQLTDQDVVTRLQQYIHSRS